MKLKHLLLTVMIFLIILSGSCKKQPIVQKEPTTGNNIGNILSVMGLVGYDENHIYYTLFKDNKASLTKRDFNGKTTVLSDNQCYYLNVVGNWIYYGRLLSNGDVNIYTICFFKTVFPVL